jgi:hypothetical protein
MSASDTLGNAGGIGDSRENSQEAGPARNLAAHVKEDDDP